MKCEGRTELRVELEGGIRVFFLWMENREGRVESLANDILICLSPGQTSRSVWVEEKHSMQMSKNTWAGSFLFIVCSHGGGGGGEKNTFTHLSEALCLFTQQYLSYFNNVLLRKSKFGREF